MFDKQEKFIRDDKNPGAILNADNKALQAYKAQKRKFNETDTMKQEIVELRTNMAEINFTLTKILEKLNN